jgi:hypothetical protein
MVSSRFKGVYIQWQRGSVFICDTEDAIAQVCSLALPEAARIS